MKPRIAYLAPEIPALSATFVYHEILALREKGFDVLSISVHPPASPATEECARALAAETIQLYSQGAASFLTAAVICKILHPIRYFFTVCMLLGDMKKVGFFGRASAGLLYRFLAATRLARILGKNGCRHLHVHFAHVPTDIAMYAASLAGITFSFTSHANDLFERGWLLKEKVFRAAQAMTISKFNRRFLVLQGAKDEKIAIVRCGVDIERFDDRINRLKLSVLNALNDVPKKDVAECAFVIGSLGRLVEKKGFDTLVAAAGILHRSGKDFRIEIAGDGPLKADLLKQAEQEGVSGCIEFLGPMANDTVPGWLCGLNQFVLACRVDSNGDMDGIPVALMESMAAGIPVISTDVSAIPELVENEISGLIVPPADPQSLADAIIRLLENDIRNRCITGGRLKVEGEFSEEANAEKLSQLFKSILSGSKP
ncbi:MAG: glycosyltransferase [Desulfuromonadales bacterium]